MKDFNNDNNTFNKSLKKKFNASSIEPSNAVWEGIEGALLKHENVKMQKRAVFYRNIAAAVLLVAVVSIYFNLQGVFNGVNPGSEQVDLSSVETGSGLYANQSDIVSSPEVNKSEVSEDNEVIRKDDFEGVNNSSSKSERKTGQFAASSGSNKKDNSISNTAFADTFDKLDDAAIASGSKEVALDNNLALSEEVAGYDNPILPNQIFLADNDLNLAVNNAHKLDKINNIQPEVLIDKKVVSPDVEVEEVSYFAISNLNKMKSSSSFAFQSAVNVGSGNFNPNANVNPGAVQPAFAALNSPPGTAGRTTGFASNDAVYSVEREIVESLSNAPIRSNVSMTFGLQFGVHLNDRLKIRTGLQYGNYRSSTESSAVIRDINSDQIFPYHGASNATELADGKIVNVTSEYNVYNDFQILSVPLLVSYKFLDRKFGIGLMAGATADIMLRNTIRGGDNQISEISFDNNESQSYKNLFYSGVAGIEFSYNFSKNYSLSLTPTYKKAFMNITNDDASFNSAPDFLSIDMSIQFTF